MVLVARVDVQFGDHEGVVEPAVVAPAAQIRLDDGGPPVRTVVGHAVDEPDEPSVGRRRAERAGARVGEVTQHDLPAYGDLFRPQPEGDGLHGERLVDAGGEIQGADDHVAGVAVALTGEARHAGTLQGGWGLSFWCGSVVAGRVHAAEPHRSQPRARYGGAVQNRTLMKAPISWKPTLRYVDLAAVLKSLT